MRFRTASIAVVFAAATAFAASPAVAGQPSASSTRASAMIPTPGPGWLVAVWTPHPGERVPARYLELVSPEGNRFMLSRLHNLSTQVADWSGDGRSLLLVTPIGTLGNTSNVKVVDLATGATEDSFTVKGGGVTASFTRPEGRAILIDTGSGVARYSLSGQVQVRFPTRVSGLGKWTGSWLESPDGVFLVLGMNHGLAVFSNGGALVARLPITLGTYCQPRRWWSSTVVLAVCDDNKLNPPATTLVTVPLSGAAPAQLARISRGGYGYLDAYQVDGQVFLQAAVPCGTPTLARLQGSTVVPVDLNLPGGGAAVVSVTSSSLALESTNGCTGQNYVSWYTPGTDSVVQVLGAPLTSGYVGVLGYPDPAATGSNLFRG